jgi:hypothetical protein
MMNRTRFHFDMDSKTCPGCSATKPVGEYYKTQKSKDGLFGKCKACVRVAVRNNRNARIDYYREYDAARNKLPDRKSRCASAFAAAAEKYPERKWAAKTLSNAVRDKRVIPQPCWVCGEKAQGHHPDYSRPLDVVWLCVKHHRQAHALVRTMDDDSIAA